MWCLGVMSCGCTFGYVDCTPPPPVYSQQPQLVLKKLLVATMLLRLHWQYCLQSVMISERCELAATFPFAVASAVRELRLCKSSLK